MSERPPKPIRTTIKPIPNLHHVGLALEVPCEVCKAGPMRPCLPIPPPTFDGCHGKRVWRGLYGEKMPPIFRKYDPKNAEQQSPVVYRKEVKGTLEEVMARAVASFEEHAARKR